LEKVTESLDSHDNVDVVYLDFAKTFDKVPHQQLIEKVEGISGNVLGWLKAWLSARQQLVCVNGQKSSWKAVSRGVPQGSVLGPILFQIFINDLDSTLISSILKFADDTKLFGRVNTDIDREVLQRDLHHPTEWSEKWQMQFNTLNTAKCVIMHFGSSNKEFDYYMDNQKLAAIKEVKDLGIAITGTLKPGTQCQQAYAKASRALGLIARSISYKSPEVLLKLYKTFVHPHVEYCVSAWSPYYGKDKPYPAQILHEWFRDLRH